MDGCHRPAPTISKQKLENVTKTYFTSLKYVVGTMLEMKKPQIWRGEDVRNKKLQVQGGGGLGTGGGGQRISKPLRGLVFENQVSEESYCQIVVVLSLFCLILDLIQHHFHLLWCGLKFHQLQTARDQGLMAETCCADENKLSN